MPGSPAASLTTIPMDTLLIIMANVSLREAIYIANLTTGMKEEAETRNYMGRWAFLRGLCVGRRVRGAEIGRAARGDEHRPGLTPLEQHSRRH